MFKPKVSIIILNYNGKQFNIDCLNSVLSQSYSDFEIIFVDNKSTDGSLEEVENIFQNEIINGKIKIIRNNENYGFAKGNNIGVENSSPDSKYIWLLNNDTIADKDALIYLIKGIESDEKIGAVGSLVLDKGYEEEIKNQYFKENIKFNVSIFGETILNNIKNDEQISGLYNTNGLSGCSLLYKKLVIDKPFEDYYFAYAEDVYFGWKTIFQGYGLKVCSKSIINHFGSGTLGKGPSELKLFHGNKNQIINFLVFFNIYHKILIFPLFMIKELGHLFMGSSIKRIKAKINGIKWILENHDKIKKTAQKINEINKNGSKFLIVSLDFKLTDIFYLNKGNIIKTSLIKTGNGFFYVYGKFVKFIVTIF